MANNEPSHSPPPRNQDDDPGPIDWDSREALRITVAYLLFAGLWIFGSDWLLAELVTDRELLVRLSTYKGFFYVFVTTILLYFLTKRSFRTLEQKNLALSLAERFAQGQTHLLRSVAEGEPSEEIFPKLIRFIEENTPDVRCSLLLLEAETGRLRHASAPSLPEAYCQAIDGLEIGPDVGSCGSAAYLKEPVYVERISSDPRWVRAAALAESYELRACWSTPILASDRETVFGTFALYSRAAGLPTSTHLRRLDVASRVATVTLEQKRQREAVMESYRNLEARVESRTEELRVALKRAEAADRIKSAFLATMSHELRTPLNSIIGFTGILLQGLAGPLNEEQTKQLTMVANSSRHLLALINDILDLSKIEAEQLKLQCSEFYLQSSLEKVVESLKPLASNKNLKLTLEMPERQVKLHSDQRRFEQVALNLIQNGLKFTENGEVAVRAEHKVLAEGDRLVLSVRDTGIGIDPEGLKHLFEAFSQLDNGLTRKHEGTGLGLAISRRLVQLLGGSIHVESSPGLGTTFSVTLPLVCPTDAQNR